MQRAFVIFVVLLSCFSSAVFIRSAHGEPMAALTPEDRTKWASVGRLNTGGIRSTRLCTATLIAPDLILTAAHCAQSTKRGTKQHFVAGWDRSVFAAHSRTSEASFHPQYLVDGKKNVAADVAVVTLETPIETTTLVPIPVSFSNQTLRTADLMLGYHKRRPHVLNGHENCALRTKSKQELLYYDCEVISGNSGGPVLHLGPDGWKVTAVLVARSPDGTQAIAVPVDAWIKRHWIEAMSRHEDRLKNGND